MQRSTGASAITANTTPTKASQNPAKSSVSNPESLKSRSSCVRNSARASNASKSEEEIIGERVKELIEQLGNKEKEIKKQFDLVESNAVSPGTDWTEEDPCVVDIKLASKQHGHGAKFRAGLGRCLLADRYLSWEKSVFGTSRVEVLVADLSSQDRRHHVQEYVNDNPEFKNKETARKGVEQGIKYRVFQRIYGNAAASGFFFFIFHLFRDFPYPGFKHLAEGVRNSRQWDKLAHEKTGWMNRCEELYKGECLIDSLNCNCSNLLLERNIKSSPRKRAPEEQISPEERRKRQQTEHTSHAPSDFQSQSGRPAGPTENTDFGAFNPNDHLDEAFTSIGQGIPRPPNVGLELSIDYLDPIVASSEFLETFCPDRHISDILTDPQYDSDRHLPQNSSLVNTI